MKRLLAVLLAAALILAGCGDSHPHRFGGVGPCVQQASGGLSCRGLDNVTAPSITGSAVQGNTLTTSNGTWDSWPRSYAYQWWECDGSGLNCQPVSGQTQSTYTLGAGDVGHTLQVRVLATGWDGRQTSADSSPSAVVTSSVTANYYVAQTAAGTSDGSSCANAQAVSTLSTATHWTAGNVIGLCGTITSNIAAQGSGTAGNPITVYWESGAKLSQAVCPSSGCFNTGTHTFLTLNGGANGIIESTANGSSLANHVSAAVGVKAMGCSNCTIENLTIQNMYVHSSQTDTTISHSQNNAILFDGSNITIQNNTMHDMGWALAEQMSSTTETNVTITGNEIYNSDHGWALETPPTSGGSIGPFIFADNHLHDYSNWDTTTDAYHHDGIHCFSQNAVDATPHFNGLYIYNNRFDGATDLPGSPDGDNMTSQVFIEGGSGASDTPCGDATSNVWLFNNVASASEPINNGVLTTNSTNPTILNNTIIGSPTITNSSNVVYGITNPVTTSNETFEDNVVTTGNQLMSVSLHFVAGQPDYNTYANGGSNAFHCGASFFSFSAFASWKTCVSADSHSQTATSAQVNLNSDGSLGAGSVAAGAGLNLTTTCSGLPTSPVNVQSACDATYAGPPSGGTAGSTTTASARPSGSTAWNDGAY